MEPLLHLVCWQAVVILKLCVGFQRIHIQNLHRRITYMYMRICVLRFILFVCDIIKINSVWFHNMVQCLVNHLKLCFSQDNLVCM